MGFERVAGIDDFFEVNDAFVNKFILRNEVPHNLIKLVVQYSQIKTLNYKCI